MLEMVLYVLCFFTITLLLQYIFSKEKKVVFWQGMNTVIVICIWGIITHNIACFAAILGFIIADEIGKAVGWHQ